MSSRSIPARIARWPHWVHNISLRRITTSTRLIPQIDGLRFIAIFMVVIDHVSDVGQNLIHPGALLTAISIRPLGIRGVDLFFTLSGFVLALPYARHYLHDARAVDIKAYFRRRLTRLEPPFMVAMLVRLVVFLLFSSLSARVLFTHFFAGLFYLHDVIYGYPSLVNLPSWSLEIEVQFYIVAPVLALIFRVGPTWMRRTAIVALILATAFLSHVPAFLNSQRIVLSLAGNLQYFLAGFLVCDLYVLRDVPAKRNWTWDIAAILCFPLAIWSLTSWFWITLPVANIILCLAIFFGRLFPRLLSLPFISIVGGMCYSIYLTHNSVFSAVHGVLVRIPMLTSHPLAFNTAIFATSFAAALCAGTIFFVLVERPCMDPAWPSKAKLWLIGKHPRRPLA